MAKKSQIGKVTTATIQHGKQQIKVVGEITDERKSFGRDEIQFTNPKIKGKVWLSKNTPTKKINPEINK